jgi:hypothetical protein
VRKLIFSLGLFLLVTTLAVRADNFTLSDGSSVSGDVLKFDGNGLMVRIADNSYTNVPWGRLSQDSLKQLSQNQKMAAYAQPFIEPSAPTHPAKSEITVKPVARMAHPAHPSVILGMVTSPVGLFILLAIYIANLVAAYEVGLIRARSPSQMIGTAAVLPIISPIVFLWMPMKQANAEAAEAEIVTAPSGQMEAPDQEVAIVPITEKAPETKVEPLIFARGKFTFNKRFVETKFAGFLGEPKGDALKYSMEVKTSKATYMVDRLMQVSPTEVILETTQPGQVTVLLADIQEVKLNPKPEAK